MIDVGALLDRLRDVRRGRLLDTPQTRRWSPSQQAAGEREERRRLFRNFREDDAGRSRHLVAEFPDDLDALAFVVAAGLTIGRLDAERAERRRPTVGTGWWGRGI